MKSVISVNINSDHPVCGVTDFYKEFESARYGEKLVLTYGDTSLEFVLIEKIQNVKDLLNGILQATNNKVSATMQGEYIKISSEIFEFDISSANTPDGMKPFHEAMGLVEPPAY